MRFLRTLALGLLASCFAAAQQPAHDDARLIAIAKLWVTVNYFHPYLALHNVKWDKALIDAFPIIRSAHSKEEYGTAVQSMLDHLGDPCTFVLDERTTADTGQIQYEKRSSGALIVSEAAGADADTGHNDAQELIANVSSAPKVVFDLRTPPGTGMHRLQNVLEDVDVQRALANEPIDLPAQLTWIHNGLPPEDGRPSPFHTAFYVASGTRILPDSPRHDPAQNDHALTFVVDQTSTIPAFAYAFAIAGKASILTTTAHYQIGGTQRVRIPLGENLAAVVRLSEPVSQNGTGLLAPSFTTTAAALETAMNPPSVAKEPALKPLSTTPPALATPSYETNPYPSEASRALAAYKTWGAARYFFAYKDLMDEDWDDVFASYLPKIVGAKDALDYHLALAGMVSHLADSLAHAESPTLAAYFGQSVVGLRLGFIGKKPAVTEILDDAATRAGIEPGDVVVKVDGEDIAPRVNREAQYVGSSTLQWLRYRMAQLVLNGPENSTVSITFSDPNQNLKTATLTRSTRFAPALEHQRTGEAVKLLSGDIGYADLDRLRPEDVDPMFEKFRNTKSIIFDLRGSVRGTARLIASRLTEEHDVASAIVTGPIALSPDVTGNDALTKTASYFQVEKLPENGKWKYKGKTVLLVDERTIGEGEQLALYAEVANKSEVIGSASAGADSVLTTFEVPGGLTITFSGQDIRHANGGKLQRVGLQPSVTADRTLTGVRKRQDEVLQKAISYVTGSEETKRLAASEKPIVQRLNRGR